MAISDTYNCDCMEFMRGMPDKAFGLCIADPPYGIEGEGRFSGTGKLGKRIMNTADTSWDRQKPPQAFFDELFRVSRNVIIWGGNYFNLPPTRCVVVWDKCQPWDNLSQVEVAWTSFEHPACLFRYDTRRGGSKIHPTQKPVALYAWLLRRFANKGDIIFDPMMGSQSSRIAACHLGFDFVGCELDKDYYREGCARFDRECMGETVCGGVKVKQLSLGL